MKILFATQLILTIAVTLVADRCRGQTVFTGLDFSFVRPTLPADQAPGPIDTLTDNVALARGFQSGLFNAVVDEVFLPLQGLPTGTQWATQLGNPDQTISADNFANLEFTDWFNAYGGSGNLAGNIVSFPAVLHLVEDDIYLDIQFTNWQMMAGGAFALLRSVIELDEDPAPGDYDGDGVVTASDYTTWIEQFGQAGADLSADGNADGAVDAADYTVWRDALASSSAPSSVSAAVAIPSPAGAILLGVLLGCCCSTAGWRTR